MLKHSKSIVFLAFLITAAVAAPIHAAEKNGLVRLSGELKQWHKVTLDLMDPESSESATPNPFMDYRMKVVFERAESGLIYLVPGYFAADGRGC